MCDDTGQEKVMQYDNAGMLPDQVEHVRMEMRIAEMIYNSIKFVRVLIEPFRRTNRVIGKDRRITHPALIHDHINAIVTR